MTQDPDEYPVDTERASAWLNEKWAGEKKCPICGSNNWDMVRKVQMLPEFRRHPRPAHQLTIPVLLLACLTCGYLLGFSAILMGLVTSTEADKELADELRKEGPPDRDV